MRIGIVGSGKIGSALASRFCAAGHEVMMSNSRGPDTLRDLVSSIEGQAVAGTVEEAVGFGEMVAVAVPLRAIRELPAYVFAGKIVIDANNYYPKRDGQIDEIASGGMTSSQYVATRLPGARVVKAFNTIHFQRLLDGSRPDSPPEERLAIPVASSDPEAKAKVSDLIDQIGFTPIDGGTLAESARQQPETPVFNEPLTPDRAREALEEASRGSR